MNLGGLYLAVYDVSQDRERVKVVGILERHGVRVQKSAFEMPLAEATRSARSGQRD
jgi:CRISPR-associated endonuclease Cas2